MSMQGRKKTSHEKKDHYKAFLGFIRRNPGQNFDFYLRWMSVLYGFSAENIEEMFRILKNTGQFSVDENGNVVMGS